MRECDFIVSLIVLSFYVIPNRTINLVLESNYFGIDIFVDLINTYFRYRNYHIYFVFFILLLIRTS